MLPKLKNKDIFAYDSLSDLESTINIDTNSEKKREIKSDGAEKVFENEKCVVYHVKSVEASCLLGKGTKWCISGNEAKTHFNDYNKQFNIYFVFDKNSKEKYAVVIDIGGKISRAYNSADKKINYSKLNGYEIPKSIYKKKPFDWKNYVEGKITENLDGSFDIDGNVELSGLQLTKLPVKFGKVSGDFNCYYNKLTSLNGAPKSVGGYFHCGNNQLKSLESASKSVGGNFYCYGNKLTSLNGAPKSVGGDFYCSRNELTNLSGAPKSVVRDFDCSLNELTNLSGAPKSVGGDFYCNGNSIKDYSHNIKLGGKLIK